ncbi:MAG: antitoxin VbhA family protein [Pseudomonadota bacterium]|nr:antitoxin VbhA family protein [Pseudomonadota bacterium]
MHKLSNIFGAFTEDAITMQDAQLSAEIEKRREIVEQVDAIHRLEGFKPEKAPDWFKELTEDYIMGNVTAEQATQKALEFIKTPLN